MNEKQFAEAICPPPRSEVHEDPMPQDDHGLTDAEYWASLDREMERLIHGQHNPASATEARIAEFDREGEGL